jgi:hypothetical protein
MIEGNGGQQVDGVGQRRGEPPRRVLGEEQGNPQGDRHRQEQGEQRHEDRHLQQVKNSEVHRRRVSGDPLPAVGEEVLSIALQRRYRAQQQESTDRDDEDDDQRTGRLGHPAKYPVPYAGLRISPRVDRHHG